MNVKNGEVIHLVEEIVNQTISRKKNINELTNQFIEDSDRERIESDTIDINNDIEKCLQTLKNIIGCRDMDDKSLLLLCHGFSVIYFELEQVRDYQDIYTMVLGGKSDGLATIISSLESGELRQYFLTDISRQSFIITPIISVVRDFFLD